MKDLTSNLDDKVLKGLRNKMDQADVEINELAEKLKQSDEVLDSLRKERDELNLKYVEKTAEFNSKVSEIKELNTSLSSKDDEINRLKSNVEELTKKNEELENSHTEQETKFKELNVIVSEKDSLIESQKTELSAYNPATPTDYTSEERLICSSCGATGKNIKQEEDKTKVLGYVGHNPMYGKINVCKKCGKKFG